MVASCFAHSITVLCYNAPRCSPPPPMMMEQRSDLQLRPNLQQNGRRAAPRRAAPPATKQPANKSGKRLTYSFAHNRLHWRGFRGVEFCSCESWHEKEVRGAAASHPVSGSSIGSTRTQPPRMRSAHPSSSSSSSCQAAATAATTTTAIFQGRPPSSRRWCPCPGKRASGQAKGGGRGAQCVIKGMIARETRNPFWGEGRTTREKPCPACRLLQIWPHRSDVAGKKFIYDGREKRRRR